MSIDEQPIASWTEEAWNRVTAKIRRTSRRIGISFPHASVEGRYDSMRPSWWTAGFWPGILWLIVNEEQDGELKQIAQACEDRLDEPLYGHQVHHDLGFIYLLSAVADFRITANEASKHRGLAAASQLASRFNLMGRYIRAWHNKEGRDLAGWSIIDTLMNLALLYWASEEMEDPRYKHIAMAHADTALNHFLRPDGSSHHIVVFDPHTGERIEALGGQGAGPDSAWSRGSAWTIYGMVISYLHTLEERYLVAAKQAAHYFIANLPEDHVPHWDFRVLRNEGTPRDTSAGACAACGLLELAKLVPETEAATYQATANRILRSIYDNYGAWEDETEEGLILRGTSNAPTNVHVDTPLIYGDFFFVEGLTKLRGTSLRLW